MARSGSSITAPLLVGGRARGAGGGPTNFFRELELVGEIVDDGGDAVWPIEARLEFPYRLELEGCQRAVVVGEPQQVAHGITNARWCLS